MNKSAMKRTKHPWLAYSFSLWILLIVCITLFRSKDKFISYPDSSYLYAVTTNISKITNQATEGDENDLCLGRYIYIHDLPSKFNADIIKNCSRLIKWYEDMCPSVMNMGLGPSVVDSQGVLQGNSWYLTSQFMVEVIFHNKMKNYKCLTKNSSQASAIYVPYYAGLDVGRYLWDFNISVRDSLPNDLLKWIVEKPEWNYMNGQDHFLTFGRTSWDFRRQTDNNSYWGNKFFLSPQAKNMTLLIIESCPYCPNADISIPYPSYFHPNGDIDVYDWQKKVRNEKRPYLYAFVGAPRPKQQHSIRNEIIAQCVESKERCKWFDCSSGVNNCDDPVHVMKVFQSANFCLQPAGDSPTRRSTFDSIVAGCIPVLFRPDSAYTQYIWHLPKNYTKYSVFIPEKDIKDGKAKIEEILGRIPEEEVKKMREEVVKLIPKTMYANPIGKLEKIEDGFDITIKRVLEKVEKIRKEMIEYMDYSDS